MVLFGAGCLQTLFTNGIVAPHIVPSAAGDLPCLAQFIKKH